MTQQSVPSVYIHIPFCLQMCYYCNFVKYFYKEHLADDYLDALDREMKTYLPAGRRSTQTIYIGGGTPSALSTKQLQKLLKILHERFDIGSCEEFTIEVNPGDLTEEKASLLKTYGVNRISFGVQVMDDVMLKQLGRRHRVRDVYHTVDILTRNNFTNVSLDLIYALPNQSVDQFKVSLDRALALDLPHYATYGLQIERDTVFYQRHKKGKLHRPAEEEEINMYEILRRTMEKNGLSQYEISNFARSGYESKHNLNYWNNGYYYGFGAGAHGYLPKERFANIRSLPRYIEAALKDERPVEEIDPITMKEQIEEEMLLGLRRIQGLSKRHFKNKFNLSIEQIYSEELNQLTSNGWIDCDGDVIRLTEKGLLLANPVFEEFILDDEFLLEQKKKNTSSSSVY
jgi:oxygen-independent coproporphyrinogen-3 oxidase